MTAAPPIETVREGDVLRIRLNRPEVRNAQTPAMWDELRAIGLAIEPDIRFVFIEGAGSDFSSGLDTSVLADRGQNSFIRALKSDPNAAIEEAQGAFRVWMDIPQVVIAAVQGNVIGAGFQLALACDIVVAAPNATFALREIQLGLVPDLGATGALLASVGYHRTFAVCTGVPMTAERALADGFVHCISEDPRSTVADLASQLRSLDGRALADMKALLRNQSSPDWGRERQTQIARLAALFPDGE